MKEIERYRDLLSTVRTPTPSRGQMEAIDEGPVYTHQEVTASLKVSNSGTLRALAYCNIHGLWESSKEVSVS